MINKFLGFLKKDYQTLNKIEISKDNLIYNYRYLSSLNRKIKIATVIKGNGYGHGILEIAKILDKANLPFFCMDSLYEAYELLKADIKTPILIMGYTDPQNFKVKKLPFSYAIFDEALLEILNKYQPNCGVHIFVDTGMHREGVTLKDLPKFLNALKKFPNLRVEGLMSHFASSDDKKSSLNKLQIRNFKKALQICKKNKIYPKWIHIANSNGLLNDTKELSFTNMARVGLSSYGVSIYPKLKPVLTLNSKIIQIKQLTKGDKVGYSETYTAKNSMTIAILPIGYFDGVDRRLSNIGYVTIDGIVCPIIGRVSMNITTIDISKIDKPYTGQGVVIYSNNPSDKNSIKNCAFLCQTIPTNLLSSLSPLIRRVII